MLAACGGGAGKYEVASAEAPVRATAASGPEADYPQVLGDPFTVDGKLYTPEDVYSYDSVGFATVDAQGGQGVSVAHKTLPMPSYVEITSLDSGKTILARVERRGPMTSQRLVSLSQGAQAQLGIGEGAPVRVRRVNPLELERAELRSGRTVPARLETPSSLLAVLKQKLPTSGGATSLAASSTAPRTPTTAIAPTRVAASTASPAAPAARTAPVEAKFDKTFGAQQRTANSAYPLPPIAGSRAAAPVQARRTPAVARRPVATPVAAPASVPARSAPVTVARAPEGQVFSLPGTRTVAAAPLPARQAAPVRSAPTPQMTADGKYVIQAAAFSNKANAERLADKLDGGFVMPAGQFYRVRVGPYATRGQAEAALAKVRAAGYRDARVFSAG